MGGFCEAAIRLHRESSSALDRVAVGWRFRLGFCDTALAAGTITNGLYIGYVVSAIQ